MWPVMQASRRVAGNSGVGAFKGIYLRAWEWKAKWWKQGTMSSKQSDWESWGTCNMFGYKVGKVTEKYAQFANVYPGYNHPGKAVGNPAQFTSPETVTSTICTHS